MATRITTVYTRSVTATTTDSTIKTAGSREVFFIAAYNAMTTSGTAGKIRLNNKAGSHIYTLLFDPVSHTQIHRSFDKTPLHSTGGLALDLTDLTSCIIQIGYN